MALISCAGWQSAGYAFALRLARSESTAYVFAAGAVAAAILAPIALTFSEYRRFMTRLASLFLAAWCLAFGVVGSLGYVSTAREASTAERASAAETRRQAKARHDAAAAELAQLAAGKASPWKAKRSAELQAIMVDASKAMKAEKAVAVVDPQAAAIAHYLAAAGYAATPEFGVNLAVSVHGELLRGCRRVCPRGGKGLRRTAPERRRGLQDSGGAFPGSPAGPSKPADGPVRAPEPSRRSREDDAG